MSYSKWIGGALGWAMGGPIGALFGFALGYIADDSTFKGNKTEQPPQRQNYEKYRHHTRTGDFSSALLVLSAAIMKADNKLMKSELDYIRDFFSKQFGEATAAQQVGLLKDLLKRDIQVKEVCEQIRYYMEHSMRLQLLYYLFGIASSDGKVDKSEMNLIEQIAGYMGLSDKDYESLKAMHYKDTDAAYKILETDKSATDEEIKKTYRRMAMKYHPDKVRGLGEQHEKSAQEKFIKVQEAYEQIKTERGMK
jgi:DnaJ like chaperone protein